VAKKKKLFQPKGTLFTYEEWAPSGVNPFLIKDYSQEELIENYKKIYSDTDLPIILSKFANEFPQNPDIALSLAKSGTSGDAVGAAARLQTILNETGTAIMAPKPWEGKDAQVNNIDYNEYLKGLNKDDTTATEQDKEDAAWFAAIKRSSRTFLTPIFSGYETAINVFRQIDGFANRNNDSELSQNPYGVDISQNFPVVGGEDASDFSRIYKNTTMYQNLREGKSVGTGFIPTGEAYQAKEALTSRVARIRSAKTGQEYFYTPGRSLVSSTTTLDPEDTAYKVITGIVDAVFGFKVDPTAGIAKITSARRAKNATEALQEATVSAKAASATAGVAEEIAVARANLPAREALEALEKQKLAAKELDDKIYELEASTDKLRKEANAKYQVKLEEAAKSAAKSREKMIEDLKEKIDQNIQKSHQELKDLIAKSQAQSEVAIKNLTQQIEQKLTNV
jgi:hypothetical protein